MDDLMRISFSLESELLEKVETMLKEDGYENRSEFFRDLIRERITRNEWNTDTPVIGTLTLIYNRKQRELPEKILQIQHECRCRVLASTRIQLGEDVCAEMIMIRGWGRCILKLMRSLKRLKGVLHADLTASTTGAGIP